jgi:hypothetical protein
LKSMKFGEALAIRLAFGLVGTVLGGLIRDVGTKGGE